MWVVSIMFTFFSAAYFAHSIRVVKHAQKEEDAVTSCRAHASCPVANPICRNGVCQKRRVVEPMSSAPPILRDNSRKWFAPNHTLYSKFVRSVFPVIGHKDTPNHALFEVAYLLEQIFLLPDGTYNGKAGLYEFMLYNGFHIEVFSNCLSAGIRYGARVSSGYLLNMPLCPSMQCTNVRNCMEGRSGVNCANVDIAQRCNECVSGENCYFTTLHEIFHGVGTQARAFDANLDTAWRRLFSTCGSAINGKVGEGEAWAGQYLLLQPKRSSETLMRDLRGKTPSAYWDWIRTHMGFRGSTPVHVPKSKRCPNVGNTQTCSDALSRSYHVLTDYDNAWFNTSAATMNLVKSRSAAQKGGYDSNCTR